MEPNKENQLQKPNSVGDDIFVVKPEPKEPVNKKSIWITVVATIVGVIVLIAVLVLALIASAGGLAKDYGVIAAQQIKKLDGPLKDIEPSLVLSNRDITGALDKIYISDQAQPSLASTIFFDDLNAQYAAMKKNQESIKKYYADLNTYTNQLKQLIAFDDQVGSYMQQEADLAARVNPDDSLTTRSVSGSYQNIAKKIKELETPEQLKGVQKALVASYVARSATYAKWALSVESGDKSTASASVAEVKLQKDKAATLVTDKNYTKLFTPSYKKLLAGQKSIESALAN